MSAILMSWKHPVQGMEGREGGSQLAIAAMLHTPAAKGVPNASKMWSPSRGAAWLSAAVAAQGNNWEDYHVGNCSQGRTASYSPAVGFRVCTKQLLCVGNVDGGSAEPHGLVRGIPALIRHREQRKGKGRVVRLVGTASAAGLVGRQVPVRHRLRGSRPSASQPRFPVHGRARTEG